MLIPHVQITDFKILSLNSSLKAFFGTTSTLHLNFSSRNRERPTKLKRSAPSSKSTSISM